MARALPRVVVNLKTYPEATGKRAVLLARASAKLERATGVAVAVAAQAVDLRACVDAGARVYAQHFERVSSSQSTGATRWESLVDTGIEGTLINHSERRLPADEIAAMVGIVRAGKLVSILCTKDADESGRLAALAPSLIAVEPPELIGGDISVTTADPGVVRRSVEAVRSRAPKLPVLCGAGVKNGDDVAAALGLGAHGVLVASGITKARDPAKALADLVAGVRQRPSRR